MHIVIYTVSTVENRLRDTKNEVKNFVHAQITKKGKKNIYIKG